MNLQYYIDKADTLAAKTNRAAMVVHSEHGGYQVYPVRDKIAEGYEVVYRTDRRTTKTTLNECMGKMYEKFVRTV